MLRTSLVIVAAGLLAGCGADPIQGLYSYSDGVGAVKGEQAYTQPADDGAVTASSRVERSTTEVATPDDRLNDDTRPLAKFDSDEVKVINRADQPLNDVTVKINGKYTTHLDTIPPHSSVTITRDQFKTPTGDLMPVEAHVDRIDVLGSGKQLTEFNPPLQD